MRPLASTPCLPVLSSLGLLALTACGGGGGGGVTLTPGPLDPGGTPATVAASLGQLGVDTTQTPRTDPLSGDLPEDYGPVGTRFEMTRRAELFVAGVHLVSPTALGARVLEDVAGLPGLSHATPLWFETAPAWLDAVGSDPARYTARRAMVLADVDGSGVDELISVWSEPSGVFLRHTRDLTSGPQEQTYVVTGPHATESLELVAADVDGDLRQELVLALCGPSQVDVLFLGDALDLFVVDDPSTRTFPAVLSGSSLSVVLAAADLDHDPGQEVALVRNEVAGAQRAARYAVLDDAAAGHAVLADAAVEFDGDGGHGYALQADLSVGDFDGDNLDELGFAGLNGLPQGNCEPADWLGTALDDAVHGLASLGGVLLQEDFSGCLAFDPWTAWWAPAVALDLDGDRIDELLVGRRVFELDWEGGLPWRTVQAGSGGDLLLDEERFFHTPTQTLTRYDRSTMALVAGDFDGDGDDDLASYLQGTGRVELTAFQAQPEGAVTVEPRTPLLLPGDAPGHPEHPILAAPNVDRDSVTLVRTQTTHQLLFTEPVLIAALAAPPCSVGIGQNLDWCFTTFGNTTSSASEEERTFTATASVTVGFGVDGGALTQSELEVKHTLRATASRATSEAYELSRSMSFTTGAVEDTVVFTCVPMDRYEYEVLDHPDTSLVGRTITVDLPRGPVLMQAEREFFNASLVDGSLQVGPGVFTHSVGDHTSYKSLGQRNQTLAANGGTTQMCTATVGVGVGQSGNTTVGLEVGEAWSETGSLEMGYEFSVQATVGGAIAGYSVGASTTDSLRITSGQEMSYTGSVGTIPAENFAANQYEFGLFTYVRTDPATGQQYQVLDYWVE